LSANLHVEIRKRLRTGTGVHTNAARVHTAEAHVHTDDLRADFTLDVSFETRAGINVLFGPSGSGKTTTLRAIAGLITPDAGRIALGPRLFFDSATKTNLAIQARRVGYVFQHATLFPHLTAAENVAYGLKARGPAKHARARALLAQFGVEGLAARYPRELSGGEQQRVALARALAPEPELLLLDEPLSAVDAQTRARLLEEIDAAQRLTGIPFIYVTHNHAEALRLGAHLVLLHKGRVVQTGQPLEVLNAPQGASAVRAVGTENLFNARIVEQRPDEGVTVVEAHGTRLEAAYHALPVGSQITLGVRAEDIIVARTRIMETSARNVLAGTIREIVRLAEQTELIVDCGVELKVSITTGTTSALDLQTGSAVYLLIKARALYLVL
jgi:molybdate transport system ATP-binding protein